MLSVIVPVYNNESFLVDCLKSIANQTSSDYELILIDDGSTDRSGEICDEFAQKFPKSIILHEENRGPLNARNKGISVATGNYLIFVDSDDCLRADAIEILSDKIKETNCDIISYGYSFGYKQQYDIDAFSAEGLEPGTYCNDAFDKIREFACTGHFNSMCNKAIRASLFKQNTCSIETKMKYGEDFFCLLMIFNQATSLHHFDDALYFCRENPSSTTHNFSSSYIDDLNILFPTLNYYANCWGKACPAVARNTIARTCYSMLPLINNSNESLSQKRKHAKEVRELLIENCGNGMHSAISSQPISPKISLSLLLNGWITSSIKLASLFSRLYFLSLRIK